MKPAGQHAFSRARFSNEQNRTVHAEQLGGVLFELTNGLAAPPERIGSSVTRGRRQGLEPMSLIREGPFDNHHKRR